MTSRRYGQSLKRSLHVSACSATEPAAEHSVCDAVPEAASANSGGLLGSVYCETSAGMGNCAGTSSTRLLMGCLSSVIFLCQAETQPDQGMGKFCSAVLRNLKLSCCGPYHVLLRLAFESQLSLCVKKAAPSPKRKNYLLNGTSKEAVERAPHCPANQMPESAARR